MVLAVVVHYLGEEYLQINENKMTDAEIICNKTFLFWAEITIYCMLISIIAAFFYRKQLNDSLRLFWVYCIINFLINLAELLYVYAVNNYTSYFEAWLEVTDGRLNFLLIFYQLKTFALLGWFYSKTLSGYTSSNWLKTLSFFLCIIAIVIYIINEGWRNYGLFVPAAEAIFLFVIPFLFLWHLFRIDLALPILKNPYFWISLGLIIPNLLSLFLFFTGDTISETDYCFFTRLANTKNGFTIIGQIFIAIGFSKASFTKYVHVN